MSENITKETLAQFQEKCSADKACRVARNAVTENGLRAAAKNGEVHRTTRHSFSVNLKQGAITDQKQSGRCWMFAALNTFRFEIIKKLNLENFELSQNYMLFYDKLEKANYFLESILETLEEPTGGRLISWLLTAPLNDGGQWDMLCNLVRKYGVVPKYAMPESKSSSATGEMNAALTVKLREDACRLRKAYAQGESREELAGKKEAMLEEIYRILSICLGEPPKMFDFEAEDKDGKLICEKVYSFEDARRELWIQFAQKADFCANEAALYEMLSGSDGKDTVVVYISSEKAMKRLPASRNVLADDALLAALSGRFGENNVKVVEKPIEKRR